MYRIPEKLSAPLELRLLRGGEELELAVRSASLQRPAGGGQELSLGQAPAAQLTWKGEAGLEEGEEFALLLGRGEQEVPVGVFTVLKAEEKGGICTYTCADAMAVRMEESWLETDCGTALEVLASVAGQCGLELAAEGLEDLPLPCRPEAGPSCRELAGQMAALFGGNALIDRLGRLTVLVWKTDAPVVAIGPDELYMGEDETSAGTYTVQSVSCVVRRRVERTEEGVTVSEETSQTLWAGYEGAPGIAIDNPFMTQERLEAIFEGLQDRPYRSGTLGFPGHPELDPGDVILLEDGTEHGSLFPVMELSWSFDGGLRTTARSYARGEGESVAGFSGPTAQAVERLTADVAGFRQLYAANLRAQRGWFESLVTDELSAVEINATKYLTGVTIVGDVIQAATLTADKLLLKGEDGLYYRLNAEAGTLSAEELTEEKYQNALDGSAIVAGSITADKLSVTDLVAFGATIGGWEIREDGLYIENEDGLVALRAKTWSPAYLIEIAPAAGTEDAEVGRHLTVDNWGVIDNTGLITARVHIRYLGGEIAGDLGPAGVAAGSGIRCSGPFQAVGQITAPTIELTGSSQIIHELFDGTSIRQILGVGNANWFLAAYDASGVYTRYIIHAAPDGTVIVPKGVSTSSDERLKRDWRSLEEYEAFFDGLQPLGYRYTEGDGRYHIGLGAQSVERALTESGLTEEDFAGLIRTPVALEEESWRGWEEEYGLTYSEFIGLLIHQVQKLKQRVAALEGQTGG